MGNLLAKAKMVHEEKVQRIDKWIERGIFAFLIFLPIISPVSVLSLLFILILFIYKLKLDRSFLKEIPLNLWMLIFILCVLLSVIFSTYKLFSLGAFILFIFYPITYFIFANSPLSEKKILNAILISGLIVTVFGVVEYLTKLGFEYHNRFLNITITGPITGIGSTLGWPNRLSKFLILITPIVITTSFVEKSVKRKIISYLFIILSLICLLLTKCLTGMIAIFAILMAILFFRRKKVFAILLIGSIILSVFNISYLRLIADRYGAMGVRFYSWRNTIPKIFRHYPLTGSGLGTYLKISPEYDKEHKGVYSHAHNLYLHYLSETGILGLGSFLLVIIMFFYYTIIYLRKSSFYSCRGIIAGGTFGIFGSLIFGMTETVIDYFQIGLLFFSIIGINMGLINKNKNVSL
ncbi:MAG: O-antigen ligase family protein [bacterium]|nr:O-antigen ligase family protein [bacterium]